MIDKTTKEVLDILQNDGKASAADIAAMLGEEEKNIAEIIAKLENEKIIAKYSAVINKEELEAEYAEALIEVKLTPERDKGFDDIARRIYRFNEVKAVYLMAGDYDLAVLLETNDMKKISKFVFEKLAVIEGVRGTATRFILRKYKEQGVIFDKEEADERLVVSP